MTKEEILEKLIIGLCSNAKFESIKKDQIIYKIGDPAERFYVITKGECFIQKAKKKISMI